MFGVSRKSPDLTAVRKRAARCERTSKKTGRMCARQFIADPNALSVAFPPRKRQVVRKGHSQKLKMSIANKLAQGMR